LGPKFNPIKSNFFIRMIFVGTEEDHNLVYDLSSKVNIVQTEEKKFIKARLLPEHQPVMASSLLVILLVRIPSQGFSISIYSVS
jgi:hypothetical protein